MCLQSIMKVKQSYLCTNSNLQEITNEESLIEYIKNHPAAVEYIDEKTPIKVYFDYDGPPSVESREVVVNQIKSVIKKVVCVDDDKILVLQIGKNHNIKTSYHIILQYICPSLKYNKLLAQRCKQICEYFDDNCYHNGQAVRLPGCSKPGEMRCKEYDYNGVITVSNDCNLPKLPVKYNQWIKWVLERCNDSSIDLIAISDKYETWLEVLFSLIYSCKDDEECQMSALDAFITFSKLSSKFDEQTAKSKFDIEWSKRNFIYNNPKSSKLRDKILKKISKKNNNIVLPGSAVVKDIVYFEELSYEHNTDEFHYVCCGFPSYSIQYLVVRLLEDPRYNFFWGSQISNNNDLQRLVSLLKCISPEELADVEYYKETYNIMVESTGFKKDPFGDKPILDNIELIADICKVLKLNYESVADKIHSEEKYENCLVTYDSFKKQLIHYSELFNIADTNDIFTQYEDKLSKRVRPRPKLENECSIISIFEYIILEQPSWKYEKPYYDELKLLYDFDKNNILFALLKCSKRLFEAEKYYRLLCSAHSDHHASEIVYHLYPYWMRTPQGVMMFDCTTGLWTRDTSVWMSVIVNLQSFLEFTQNKTKKNYGSTVDLTDKVVKRIPLLLPNNYDLFEDLKDTSTKKLLFGNGVYDGDKNEFTEAMMIDGCYCFTNYYLFFTGKINDPYLMEVNEQILFKMEEMKKVLFYDMHGFEIGEYHRECLSLAIMGERHKGFYVHVGETNSGKSTEKALLEASFGSFIGTGLVDELSAIKDDKRDGAISNSMVWDNWDKRLLLFSEKNQRKIDTEKLKSYSSGGQDKIRARTQYQKSALFDIKFIMLFYLNHPLEVTDPSDPAFIDRARCFHWEKSFVDPNKITDPTCQIPKRDDVCEWQYIREQRQIFVKVIIDAYIAFCVRGTRLPTPKKVMYSTTATVGKLSTNDDLIESFLGHFIVDGSPNLYMEKKDIEKVCTDNNIDCVKFIRRLPIVMKDIGLDTSPIQSKQVRIKNNKKVTIWKGIRLRDDEKSKFPILADIKMWKLVMKRFNCQVPTDFMFKLGEIQKLKDHKFANNETNRKRAEEYEVEVNESIGLNLSGQKREREYDDIDSDELLDLLNQLEPMDA